ncbi:MAG: hypothetical protein WCP79_08210 [Bacillota bacterium]
MKASFKLSAILVLCLLFTGLTGSIALAEYYNDYSNNNSGFYDPQQTPWNQGNLNSNKAWIGFGIGGSTMNVNGPAQNSGIPTSGVVGTIDFGYKWTYAAVRAQFSGASVSSTWYNVLQPWQQYSYTVGAYTYDFQVLGVLPIEKMADLYAGIGIGGLSLDYSGYISNGWSGAVGYASASYFNVPISVGADFALGQNIALNFDATYNMINGGNDAPQSYTTYTGGVKFMM